MSRFAEELPAVEAWLESPRFDGITRLYGAAHFLEQRGSIRSDYTIARDAAQGLYALLRERFEQRRSITTFGPYSPGQAVSMKRLGG